MTREARVVVSVDTPAIKKAIAEAAARAVNQAAESMRWIRDYIDELDASFARCEKRHGEACSVCVERRQIAAEIRPLLPVIREAAGEVGDVGDRDL